MFRLLCSIAGLITIAAMVWWLSQELRSSDFQTPDQLGAVPGGRSEHLARTRLSGRLEDLDRFVAEQTERAEQREDDPAEWRVLAEAHLERCLLRDTPRGMAVGQPTHAELPEPNRQDITAGLQAAGRAIELHDPTGDAHRIRAALLSLSVTGLASFLENRPAATESLAAARSIDPANPRVLFAAATEKLFAPRFFGHDPAAAMPMLERAAEALPLDERPHVFAAFACWLGKARDRAIHHLELATERNPNNVYAQAVLQRLRRDEPEPFSRDVQ